VGKKVVGKKIPTRELPTMKFSLDLWAKNFLQKNCPQGVLEGEWFGAMLYPLKPLSSKKPIRSSKIE
jgi:hypothetical protein